MWRHLLIGTTVLALAGCTPPAAERSDTAPSGRTEATTASAAPQPDASATASPRKEATPAATTPPGDVAVAVPEPAYSPRNDCEDKPGWSQFRAQAAGAVTHRDALALAALASPDVTLDYGGGSGSAELRRRLADSSGTLWADLAQLLTLGCAVQGELAVMPWYFWNLPDDADAANAMIGTDSRLPLLDRARPDAKVMARLDWPLVTIALPPGFDPKARYTRVTTHRALRQGYIETAKLRSLLARRLIAEHKDDGWKITALVAGD